MIKSKIEKILYDAYMKGVTLGYWDDSFKDDIEVVSSKNVKNGDYSTNLILKMKNKMRLT